MYRSRSFRLFPMPAEYVIFLIAGAVVLGVMFFRFKAQRAVVTPAEFTSHYIETLQRNADPAVKVTVVQDLELKVKFPNGEEPTIFLNNAYDQYRRDPREEGAVLAQYVAGILDLSKGLSEDVSRQQIVPVVKDRPWITESMQALRARGLKEAEEPIYDDLTPELVVAYAEDSPRNVRYLSKKDLELAKIERGELRSLACENLRRILPNIRREGGGGTYMVIADGTYEASLLLLDSTWAPGEFEVQGEIVVAIPTRDVLLVTGSQDPGGLEKVRRLVRETMANGAYTLTDKLFVRRDGKFEEWK